MIQGNNPEIINFDAISYPEDERVGQGGDGNAANGNKWHNYNYYP